MPWAATVFGGSVHHFCEDKFGGSIDADEIGIPMKDSDLILPCGIYARWEKEER